MRKAALVVIAVSATIAAAACSRSESGQQDLASVVARNVVNSVVPAKFRVQNLPSSFSVMIPGEPGGKYWDQHGRTYGVLLSIWCMGRESSARLSFPVTIGSASPLPARGDLRIALGVDGKPPRWVALERTPGLAKLAGGLDMVRELLSSKQVTVVARSFEGEAITGTFDTRGLRDAVAKHDYFCKSQWLSANAAVSSDRPVAPVARRDAGQLALRRELVRAQVAKLDGVTSVIWLGDGTLMLGMGDATNRRKGAAALDACDVLQGFPELPRRVEVQDTRATSDRTMRVTCPG